MIIKHATVSMSTAGMSDNLNISVGNSKAICTLTFVMNWFESVMMRCVSWVVLLSVEPQMAALYLKLTSALQTQVCACVREGAVSLCFLCVWETSRLQLCWRLQNATSLSPCCSLSDTLFFSFFLQAICTYMHHSISSTACCSAYTFLMTT